jgi:hypothetical protein
LAKRSDEITFTAAERKLSPDTQQGCELDALDEPPGMEVHLALEASITGCIGRRQIVDLDRGSIRHDDALPDDQRLGLPERHDVVIAPDEARTQRPEYRCPLRPLRGSPSAAVPLPQSCTQGTRPCSSSATMRAVTSS